MRRPSFLSVVAASALVILASGCFTASQPSVPAPEGATRLSVAPDFSGTIWAATRDEEFRSRDGGHSWQRVPGSSGGQAVTFTEHFAYLVGPDGAQRGNYGADRLTDPRPTPARFIDVTTPYHRTDRVLALDDAGNVWLSVRAGSGWRRLRAEGLPPGGVAIAAARDLVTEPDTILVAAGAGGLWRSTDDGATFGRVDGVPAAVDAAMTTDDQDRILVATGEQLFLSTDRGRTFRETADIPAVSVAFDPRNHRLAYASAGGVLHRSTDGGAGWE